MSYPYKSVLDVEKKFLFKKNDFLFTTRNQLRTDFVAMVTTRAAALVQLTFLTVIPEISTPFPLAAVSHTYKNN